MSTIKLTPRTYDDSISYLIEQLQKGRLNAYGFKLALYTLNRQQISSLVGDKQCFDILCPCNKCVRERIDE